MSIPDVPDEDDILHLAQEYNALKTKEETMVAEAVLHIKTIKKEASNVSEFQLYLKWKKWVNEQKTSLSHGVFGHLVRDEALCEQVLSAVARSTTHDKSIATEIQELARSYNYMCHKEKYESEAYDFHRYIKWKIWVKEKEKELSRGPLGHLVRDETLCEKVLAEAARSKKRSQRAEMKNKRPTKRARKD